MILSDFLSLISLIYGKAIVLYITLKIKKNYETRKNFRRHLFIYR